MRITSGSSRLRLPDSLRDQLVAFRSRLWSLKLIEAGCSAVFCLLAAFVILFALDRAVDTPAGLRWVLLGAALGGIALVPVALYRWVWRRRSLDQLARLLSRKHPGVGDQLLGVIELVRSESEQARSLALCEAAVLQVAEAARRRDFGDAVPQPRHRSRALLAVLALVVAGGLFAWVPGAAGNAWARLLAPWGDTPRFTFTRFEALPDKLVVAHGEPFRVTARLAESTAWRPESGAVRLGVQPVVTAALQGNDYAFELPSQLDAAWLEVKVGDFRDRILIEPTLRPELTAISAEVALPEYLGRSQPLSRDVRGGSISLVEGSRVTFVATASRALSAATIDGQALTPAGAQVRTPPVSAEGSRKLALEWRDELGLSGKQGFAIALVAHADEPPSLSCDDLPRQKVVLDTEALAFTVKAQDDFGVKVVGMEWEGVDPSAVDKPARGERALGSGGSEAERLELVGTFSAQALAIEPQPIQLRLFVEDYLPGRARVYSAPYLFHVLNAEQHALWLTEMLSKWHRQSLEVRDREMQLFETNKQLRELTPEELDHPDTRKRLEAQATAERANGRRLTGLVATGEDLVRQAMRNPEFGVGHLDKWAEMLQVLKDIASNRMPSVADLLKQAATAQVAAASAVEQGPMAGQIRSGGRGAASAGAPPPKNPNRVPTLADIESSQQPAPDGEQAPSPPGSSSPRLGLAQTSLMGASKGGGPTPAGGALDAAIAKQQDLLAEFEKVADELNRILANLEGSTLVKRLKAQSRLQLKLAGKLGDQVPQTFGSPAAALREPQGKAFAEVATQEVKSSTDVSLIMDDMLAYFERRRLVKFRMVLDEMRKKDVVGNLRQLGEEVRKENALAMAQCEYWSDHLDRWAEDLVDPSRSGC